MGRDTFVAAQETLDEVRKILRKQSASTWRVCLPLCMTMLREDPVIGPLLADVRRRGVPPLDGHLSPAPPAEVRAWGERAYMTLQAVSDHVDNPTELPLDSRLLREAAQGFPEDYRRKDINSKLDIVQHMYVLTMIRWLRRELNDGAALEYNVERWIQRAAVFGVNGGLKTEKHLQVDLHRYIFDAGAVVAPEFSAGRGKVDFFFFGDQPCAVELKLWTGTGGKSELRKWFHQALRYPKDLGVHRAYLVIAFRGSSRLELTREISAPNCIAWSGVSVHVRLLDLAPPSPSKDNRKTLILDRLLLTGQP